MADAGDPGPLAACASDAVTGDLPANPCLIWEDLGVSGGNGVTSLPGDGDTKLMWTPFMLVNAPYHGEATKAAGTAVSTSFNFGLLVSGGLSAEYAQRVAITAADGTSFAAYVEAEWTYTHQKYDTCAGSGVTSRWIMTDTAPSGQVVVTTGQLTGESRLTDADNPVVADLDGAVMAIDGRFKDADATFCTAAGSPFSVSTGNSQQYELGLAFEYLGAKFTGSSTTTVSGSYEFKAPGGLCHEVDYMGDGEAMAYQYLGVSDQTNPRVSSSLWAAGSSSGNDANIGYDGLDEVEAIHGPRETNLYHYSTNWEDVDHGVLRVDLDFTKNTGVTNKGAFGHYIDDVHGFSATWQRPDWTTFSFSSGIEFRADYEYDQSLMTAAPANVSVPSGAGGEPGGNLTIALTALPDAAYAVDLLTTDLAPERIEDRQAVISSEDLSAAGWSLAQAIVDKLVSHYDPAGKIPKMECPSCEGVGEALNDVFRRTQTWAATNQAGYYEKEAGVKEDPRLVDVVLDIAWTG